MRRRRREPATRPCLACAGRIATWKLLCDACLKALPWARRRALLDAPRHLKFSEAQGAAAWLAEHGPAAEAVRRMGEKIDG